MKPFRLSQLFRIAVAILGVAFCTAPVTLAADAVTSAETEIEVRYTQAPLREVLRSLAEAAGISFIGLPAGAAADVKVDLTARAQPLALLRALAAEHGYSFVSEEGVWRFERISKGGHVSVVYALRHINTSTVESAGSTASAAAMSPGSAGALPPAIGASFKLSPDKIIADLRALLAGMASENGDGSVESPAVVLPQDDRNAIFVVASPRQHQWVRDYLAAADQPRPLVLLELRFVEVSQNPTRDLGLDWFGSLENGLELGARDPSGPPGGTPGLNGPTLGDFSARLSSSAILTAEQLRASLRAFASDSRSRNVQLPRQVTLGNRETVLRSVVQVPFESGTTSITGGASATSATATSFIPVGTSINLLPRVLEGGNVELSILINVSDIVGEKTVGTNRVPITSSRDFSGQAIVTSGSTLAIGGLERVLVSRTQTEVPYLSRMPLFGMLFRREQSSDDRSKLLMFITPTILPGYSGGVPSSPEIDSATKAAADPWSERAPVALKLE